MKIYSKINVYEAAKKRINRLFDEFDQVVVSFSGGKDSTVVLELALEVAKEKGKLPLPVMFLDQECEWQSTIDYVKEVMYRKDVKPYWYQIPMVITNNASTTSRYHYCWDVKEKADWIHEQDKIAITENNYGTDRFHELFIKIAQVDFIENTCYLAGVRTEESPTRYIALTSAVTYKDITWGKILNKSRSQYTFYPIFDWSYTDVWKYINEKDCKYNNLYNELYKQGVKVMDMRVSNLHHETALKNLLLVQEIEPKTWNKVSKKIEGANTIKHIKGNSFTCPRELPYMFEDWREYALHLAKYLVPDENYRELLSKKIESHKIYHDGLIHRDFWRKIIDTILSSDFDFTNLKNWTMSSHADAYRRYHMNPKGTDKVKSRWIKPMTLSTKYLTLEQKLEVLNYFKNGEHKKSN